jgi:hypothetical protein
MNTAYLATILLLINLSIAAHAEDRVFFAFDDHSIPWQHNLKVTMVPATKHPENPVLRRGPEGAPDHGHAVLYGTVIKAGGKFRMWYLGMIETEIKAGNAPGWWRPMCYAESADGVRWTKPELGLVDLNGNQRNNICLIEGAPHYLTRVNDFLSILHEPNDPDPTRRYKAAYIVHPHYEDIRGGMSKIGIKDKRRPVNPKSRLAVTICATSADGLSWKVVGDRPVNAEGERFEVSSLYRFGDFYYSTGQLISPWAWRADGTDVGRVMLAYRSPDFVKWSQAKAFSFARPGQLTNPPATGQQVHMGAGLWNRGNVLVGLYGMWQDAPVPPPKGAMPNLGAHADLGLIVSNDGIHFREPVPDFKVIAHGKEGEWDDIALLQGHAFVNVGEQTMIWYSHWDTGGKLKSMEIGLATLRRDGFGYLSCKEDDNNAHFITAPFTTRKGGKLLLNLDGITSDTPLTVELLDGRDGPVAGYSGTDSASIVANGTQHEVVWPKTQTASLPGGQQLAAKVNFPVSSKARIFALYVTE